MFYIATMAISQLNTRLLINQEFIADLAQETADDIYTTQIAIARTMQSQTLAQYLQTKPYQISKKANGVVMTLNYRMSVRFADMKWGANGKKKDDYNPIYNKIVFGFIYSFMYKQLIYGVGRNINAAIEKRLTDAGLIKK